MGAVRVSTERLSFILDALEEAHCLGVRPGPAAEMISYEFHQSVAHIYTATLPRPYLGAVARLYRGAAREMQGRRFRPGTIEAWAWTTVQTCLANVGRLFHELAGDTPDPLFKLPERPSPIIRFAQLAETISLEAVSDLRLAVSTQLALPSLGDTTGPEKAATPEQQELLAALARGESVLDLARSKSVSERSMYRQLKTLLMELGVGSRAEAIALAAELGWLRNKR